MVWPRRKIQLVASSAAPGIGGVRAVLKGMQLDFSEFEPTKEDLAPKSRGAWMEMPFDSTFNAESDESGPVTELVYWPGQYENDYWRERALAQGIKQLPVESLLHSLLEDEQIIWISEPTVLIEERPLLAHILTEAGFEPTILWPAPDGIWQFELKQGLYWLISESWPEGLMEKSSLGRKTIGDESQEKASWVIRENQIDFYRWQNNQKFVGYLPRWPRLFEEQTAAQNIAKCIDLGVSWLDIRLALSSLWKNIKMADNLRWKINDFGWNAGARGEELSAPSIEHVENWRAR